MFIAARVMAEAMAAFVVIYTTARDLQKITPRKSSGRTFSWHLGSCGCPGVREGIQRIMK
jgi:hypothetical protein